MIYLLIHNDKEIKTLSFDLAEDLNYYAEVRGWKFYEDYQVGQAHVCRGCHKSVIDNPNIIVEECTDWYGINTGAWCNECYNSNVYPFSKGRYPTIEHDGYGDRLGLDED